MAAESSTAPVDAGSSSDARVLPLLIAAGLVAIVTVVLVVTIGVARPPALESMEAMTQPERSLAMLGWRDDGNCLDVISPDGTLRTVRCGLNEYGQLIAWDERGIGVVRFGPSGEQVVFLDASTGLVVARESLAGVDGGRDPFFPMASTERSEGELVVRDPDGRVVWRVAAPDSYRITASVTDPVTGRMALLDSASRLLVLEPGAAAPRIWVDETRMFYAELVWEGTDLRSE
jgi:hypothetical protein